MRRSSKPVGTTPELTFLDSAPASLRYLYRISAKDIRDILRRLLTPRAMADVWKTLAKHTDSDIAQRVSYKTSRDPYWRLWREIAQQLLRSRRLEKTWKAIDDDLGRIAKLAGDLRKEIVSSDREDEDKPPERRRRREDPPKTGERFDHRSLEEYCPEIIKQINNQRVILDGSDERRGGIVEWPMLSEVLDELIRHVERERESERSRDRSVKHDKKTKAGESNRRQRVFVVGLAQYLERVFGLDRRTESIPVTAAIAAAVFKEKILRDFVRKALRGN